MSGHSKWSKIKRKKGANDAARGQLFTKLSKNITLAAQQGGGDPEMNFTLRIAIDKAKAQNLPSDKIEKAIKKGAGELGDASQYVSLTYEGYGPGGVAILITCQTDNTNRALTEVKNIVTKAGGKLAPEGSVSWQFAEKGIILLRPQVYVDSGKFGKEGTYSDVLPEDVELQVMEIDGVVDVQQIEDDGEDFVETITQRDEFSRVHKQIEQKGYKIESAEIGWLANELVDIDNDTREKLESLIEELEENDEVTSVWHNSK